MRSPLLCFSGYLPAQHSALQGTPFSQASPVVAATGQLPVGSSLLTTATVPQALGLSH